jgi:hypothetical protein
MILLPSTFIPWCIRYDCVSGVSMLCWGTPSRKKYRYYSSIAFFISYHIPSRHRLCSYLIGKLLARYDYLHWTLASAHWAYFVWHLYMLRSRRPGFKLVG